MKDWVIVYRGIEGKALNGRLPRVGAFLASYDADAHDGRGWATWTTEPTKAMRFPNAEAAHATWSRQSVLRPYRADGRANRPLTAFTVAIERAA